MKPYPFLLLAFGTAAGCQAQVPNVAAPADAFAAIATEADLRPVPPLDAPALVAIPRTNQAIPKGALFVSPDGSAKASGAQNAPTTLENALKKVRVGGVIVLRGGVYRGVSNLKIRRKMTLQAFPGEAPWISGSVVVSDWTSDGKIWKHFGWTSEFPRPERIGDEHLDPKYPLAIKRDMLFFNGRALRQVASREEVGPGRFWVDDAGDALLIGDDPTGQKIEATAFTQGLEITNRDGNAGDGVVLHGIGFQHYADQGLTVRAQNVTLEKCAFAWNGQRGLNAYDCRALTLRGNSFVCNSRVGARISRTPRLLVEDNWIAHNNVDRWRTAWDAAGIKITDTNGSKDVSAVSLPGEGPIVRRNRVENNYSSGIWLDIAADYADIRENLVRGNASIGLFFEISEFARIASNVCENNTVGIMVSNARDAFVVSNTLVSNKTGLVVKQTNRVNRYARAIARTPNGQVFQTRDNRVFKNIFFASEPSQLLLSASSRTQASAPMLVQSDLNLFARAQNAVLVRWTPADAANTANFERDFQSLAEVQAQTEREKSSMELFAPPQTLFANASQGDYRLQPLESVARWQKAASSLENEVAPWPVAP